MNDKAASTESKLTEFLDVMWKDYCQMTPHADKIYTTLTQMGESVLNDHIALRTVSHPRLGIQSLAQHFLNKGYYQKGEYFFKEKKLYAQHFENENPHFPKVFISELELHKVSPFIQETFGRLVTSLNDNQINEEKFVYGGRPWVADYGTYQKLAQESEYASWVYAFGFRPNHFTVNINQLKNFKDISRLNTFLKNSGFKLNSSGGEIKGTPQELLEQSSTMADSQLVQFADGIYSIPSCYYEFAKRYPMVSGELYQGFIAQSADKIFESTNKI